MAGAGAWYVHTAIGLVRQNRGDQATVESVVDMLSEYDRGTHTVESWQVRGILGSVAFYGDRRTLCSIGDAFGIDWGG